MEGGAPVGLLPVAIQRVGGFVNDLSGDRFFAQFHGGCLGLDEVVGGSLQLPGCLGLAQHYESEDQGVDLAVGGGGQRHALQMLHEGQLLPGAADRWGVSAWESQR